MIGKLALSPSSIISWPTSTKANVTTSFQINAFDLFGNLIPSSSSPSSSLIVSGANAYIFNMCTTDDYTSIITCPYTITIAGTYLLKSLLITRL